MIPKVSSQELNNILENAQSKLSDTQKKFEAAKKDVETKIKVISYETEYSSHVLNKINTGSYVKSAGMISFSKLPIEEFGKYGSTVHSKLIKEPINVFNLQRSGLGEAFFREDVTVAINNSPKSEMTTEEWVKAYDYDEKHLGLLKDDIITDKEIFFDTYKNKYLTIKIELRDLSAILGPTRFNCIEIDPFMSGSFNINEIRVYEFLETGETNQEPARISNITDVGKERIILNKKINFYKMEIDIEMKYETYRNTSPVYPFGLKHLYFYDMDFKADSHIIAEITSENNIAYVKSEILVKTPTGTKSSTISTEGIELYLDKNENKLSTQIESSSPNDIKEIARNVKKIYAKIPLSTKSSLVGIAFHAVDRIQTS